MKRRTFLTGLGAAAVAPLVPSLPAVAEVDDRAEFLKAFGGEVVEAYNSQEPAVFIRTSATGWKCIQEGFLRGNPEQRATIDRMLDLMRKFPLPHRTEDTEWATFRPPVHDSYGVELGQTARVPFPEPSNGDTHG